VSAALWAMSGVAATWRTERAAIMVLVIGGFLIFPLTTLLLRLTGKRAMLPAGHPMNSLAVQIAFTLPLCLPLVGAAAVYRISWFYPAFMIALGAHYLPFTFLYGMRLFAGLCGVLVGAGLSLGLWGPATFSPGAWITTGILVLAAIAGRLTVEAERRHLPEPA
jgi:hypothetical protein